MQLIKSFSSSKHSTFRKMATAMFLLFLFFVIIGSIFLYVGIRVSRNLIISHYTIKENVSDTIRIVHISDLHNTEFGKGNGELVSAIRNQNPDFIFMTGDMINQDDTDIHVALNLVAKLSNFAPVYYGYGNHEAVWEDTYGDGLHKGLEENGAVLLETSYVDIDYNGLSMRIGGCMNYYRAWGMLTNDPKEWQVSENFADNFENTNRYRILLNHIPTAWVDWGHGNDYDVDLVFSGHYHGGMVRIPVINRGLYAPYVGIFPKYTKGIFKLTKSICILNAGLGSEHQIPRIYNPPDISVIDLVP